MRRNQINVAGCWEVGYSKESHATEAMNKMMRRHGDKNELHVYKCPRCKRFHIGHDRYS